MVPIIFSSLINCLFQVPNNGAYYSLVLSKMLSIMSPLEMVPIIPSSMYDIEIPIQSHSHLVYLTKILALSIGPFSFYNYY